jgi:hypothetical protein
LREGRRRKESAEMGGRILLAIACFLVLLPYGLAAQTAAEPPDMQKYIAEIRQYGMSEMGKSALTMVASIRNGYTELTFPESPDGSYGMAYSNLFCKNPNADPDLARNEREVAEMKNGLEMIRLKPLADADKSGFVTTEEGMQFRQLVEFVYRIAYVSGLENNDMQKTCKAMGMFEDAVRQKLADYEKLQEQLKELGLAPLPMVTLK